MNDFTAKHTDFKLDRSVYSLSSEDVDFISKRPIRFKDGNFADYIWGGFNLYDLKGMPKGKQVAAESWEISGHKKYPSWILMPDGREVKLSGLLKNIDFAKLILGEDVVKKFGQGFPILIKFVDVQQCMSVQVHPTQEVAEALGESEPGKEEIFVVLDVYPKAEGVLYVGLKDGVTRKAFEDGITNKENMLAYLHKIYLKPKEAYRIQSGVPHCWTGGALAVEITESSDLTYRMYDFDRNRFMHIEKGLAAIDFDSKRGRAMEEESRITWQQMAANGVESIVTHNYIKVERLSAGDSNPVQISSDGTFDALMGIEGEMEIASVKKEWLVYLGKGHSLLIPANAGDYQIRDISKVNRSHILRIRMKHSGRGA